MARGLLVSYAGYPITVSSLFPDNGLASLAGVLISAGHEVKVLDYNTVGTARRLYSPRRSEELSRILKQLKQGPLSRVTDKVVEMSLDLDKSLDLFAKELLEDISREVQSQGSDFVGFKLWSGDGLIGCSSIADGLKRRFPNLKIYGGGPAVLYARKGVYELGGAFDALVDGEAEESILLLAAFAEGKADLNDVPNLILKEDGTIKRTRRAMTLDLNTLPLPCYDPDVYPSLEGDQQIKFFVLDESRGCPMGCAFCVHRDASGSRWRIKSGKRVISEISEIKAKTHTVGFRLGGSFTPPKFYRDLLSESEGMREGLHLCSVTPGLFPKTRSRAFATWVSTPSSLEWNPFSNPTLPNWVRD
ncbi:MAG: hypothetical protein GXP49_07155 [Deltaproteobacteria bacterium]|nr:hypothetical protein [Deltaproteobacteria bacterium]